jgi:hypothetical protein
MPGWAAVYSFNGNKIIRHPAGDVGFALTAGVVERAGSGRNRSVKRACGTNMKNWVIIIG